jgi:uncharacterized protein (DUF983 family)
LIAHVTTQQEPASPLATAFTHRCPSCQEGSLYAGLLRLKDTCNLCGLDYSEHDVGDGPAFFTITLLGFVVVGLAFALEIFVRPSYAVHAAVVLGAMALLTPVCLRFFKSYLIALKYKVHWSQGIQ